MTYLGNMLPSHATADLGNGGSAYSKPLSNLLVRFHARRAEFSDGPDFFFGQDGIRNLIASFLSSLPDHVEHVIAIRADEEMVGPNATPVVAVVTNHHVVGDRTVRELPRHTMGQSNVSVRITKHAVPIRAKRALPLPAIIGFGDFVPKTISDGPCTESVRASSRTEAFSKLSPGRKDGAASATHDGLIGILGVHFWSLLNRFRGAVPQGVISTAGVFVWINYTKNPRRFGGFPRV